MSDITIITMMDKEWQRVSIERKKYISLVYSGRTDGCYIHYGVRRALRLHKSDQWAGLYLNYVDASDNITRHMAQCFGPFTPLAAQAVAVELVKSQRNPMEVEGGRYKYDSSER